MVYRAATSNAMPAVLFCLPPSLVTRRFQLHFPLLVWLSTRKLVCACNNANFLKTNRWWNVIKLINLFYFVDHVILIKNAITKASIEIKNVMVSESFSHKLYWSYNIVYGIFTSCHTMYESIFSALTGPVILWVYRFWIFNYCIFIWPALKTWWSNNYLSALLSSSWWRELLVQLFVVSEL